MRRLYSLYAGPPSTISSHFAGFRAPASLPPSGPRLRVIPASPSIGCSFILINGGRENYSRVVRGKCLLGELRGEREADRIRVSQQFTPAGAAETKRPPIFHSAAAHPCHLTSAIKRAAVPCPWTDPSKLRSCVAKGNCASSSLVHLVSAAIVRPQIRRAREPQTKSANDDGQRDNCRLSPHSCAAIPGSRICMARVAIKTSRRFCLFGFFFFFLRCRCCAGLARISRHRHKRLR